MTRTAYVNLGSNIGDRLSMLERAVAAVEAALGAKARATPPIESEPWGYDSANHYLNIGIAIPTELEPEPLLETLLKVQHTIDPSPHRDADGRYLDRAIDIDLIALDELSVNTPALTLPHPRMHLRPFVLKPMATLAPAWRHPRLHLTPAQLLATLK